METKEKKKLTPEADPQSQEPETGTQSADYQTAGYTESASVKQAEDMLKQQMANKPGAYQSTWQQQANDTLQQILNRKPFTYDLNSDALYQQLTDQYVGQGKMAMMDTVGQTAALTGGYGKWADERNFGYQKERDAAADKQWQAEFDEAVRQWNALHGGDAGGSSGGNGGGNPGTEPEETEEPTNGDTVVINGVSYTRDQIEAAQKYLNIPVTGEWDSASASAAKGKGYGHFGAVLDAMDEHDGDHTLDSQYVTYDDLMNAVTAAKGAYSDADYSERSGIYKESLDAINHAFKNGLITRKQRDELLNIAVPGPRSMSGLAAR